MLSSPSRITKKRLNSLISVDSLTPLAQVRRIRATPVKARLIHLALLALSSALHLRVHGRCPSVVQSPPQQLMMPLLHQVRTQNPLIHFHGQVVPDSKPPCTLYITAPISNGLSQPIQQPLPFVLKQDSGRNSLPDTSRSPSVV